MKTIGMIFDDVTSLNAAFYMHAYSGCQYNPDIEVNTGMREIKYLNVIYKYIIIKDEKDVMKIAGINFDSIFSEVKDPYCKNWILSRFRPRFD